MSKVIPEDLTYVQIVDSARINRVPVRTQADTQTYGVSGKIQIQLPNDFSDLRGSYLTFNAIAPLPAGSTYVRFSFPVQTAFQRAQVYLGSQIIEDIDDYGVLAGMFKLCSSFDSVNNLFNEGVYANATRATQTAAGRLYIVRLRLESLERVWALNKIKLPMRIVLTVAPEANFIERDGATAAVPIFSDVYLNYHSIQVPQDVDALIDAQINSGKLRVCFRTWDNYNVQLQSATSNTLMLPFKRKCVNSIIAGWRPSADISNPAVTDKYTDDYTSPPIQTFVKILSQVYPADKYDMNFNFGYLQMNNVLNSVLNTEFHSYDRQQDTFQGQAPAQRILAAYDLRRDSSPKSGMLYDNGVDTSGSANSQQLGLLFSIAPGAIAVDAFARWEEVVTITSGGNIIISD
jgi:hypothetical protein